MTDYKEDYERVLADKHRLMREISTLVKAIEDYQLLLGLERLKVECLTGARGADDATE